MHKTLITLLICPICRGELESRIIRQDETHFIEGEFTCKNCKRKYPVVDGIAIFLDNKETRDDLWKEQEDFATRFRKEHPIQYFFLTKTFLGNIKPEHHFLKGLLLEDEKTLEKATRRIYTKDYLTGYERTKQALREVEKDNPSIILEIACGRGGFFKPFIQSRRGKGVYVATDFSTTVLRNNLKWLRVNGLEGQVTLIAFDAKSMPFQDNSVSAMVSNVGFPNIRNDGKAVEEAFRVLVPLGILITNFMLTTEQTKNYAKAKELSLQQFYTRKNVEEEFKKAGFEFSIEELSKGSVRPTPGGIDSLPKVQDVYSFCVVKAKKPEQ
jgi:ubiquinone/menaquinone biosynthesis C-methylase UbiE/uncharacterized protein YbaR (Trm112 family)